MNRPRAPLSAALVVVLGAVAGRPAAAGDRGCDVLTPADAARILGRPSAEPAVSSEDGCAYVDGATGLTLTLVLLGGVDPAGFERLRGEHPTASGALGLGVPGFSESTPSSFVVHVLRDGQAFSLSLEGRSVSARRRERLLAIAGQLSPAARPRMEVDRPVPASVGPVAAAPAERPAAAAPAERPATRSVRVRPVELLGVIALAVGALIVYFLVGGAIVYLAARLTGIGDATWGKGVLAF